MKDSVMAKQFCQGEWLCVIQESESNLCSSKEKPETSEHFRRNTKLIFPDNEDPLEPEGATEIDLCISDVN